MKLAEERHLMAGPAVVWAAISNPDSLRPCLPGCESLTGSAHDGFEAVVTQRIGPLKVHFASRITLTDIVDGKSLQISATSKGGAAGFAKGGAFVTIEAEGTGTKLTYEVEGVLGGKLARLGGRVIDSFARGYAEAFFTRFQAALDDVEAPETVEVAKDGEPVAVKRWFHRWVA